MRLVNCYWNWQVERWQICMGIHWTLARDARSSQKALLHVNDIFINVFSTPLERSFPRLRLVTQSSKRIHWSQWRIDKRNWFCNFDIFIIVDEYSVLDLLLYLVILPHLYSPKLIQQTRTTRRMIHARLRWIKNNLNESWKCPKRDKTGSIGCFEA